jgi:hypothetical protein
VDSGLKPVDLYDIAKMCAAAYRSNPSVSGWRTVPLAEMRLTESRLASVPYVNRAALAWFRPALASRRAMVAVVVRSHASMSRMPADATQAPDAVETVTPIIAAVVGWAERNGVRDVIITGHHVGAMLACEIVVKLRFDAGTRVTVVAFGARGSGGAARNVSLLEVVRGMRDTDATESGRPDEYLYDIRALYEAGDLADMLRKNDTHTVIRLPAAARQ